MSWIGIIGDETYINLNREDAFLFLEYAIELGLYYRIRDDYTFLVRSGDCTIQVALIDE